MNKLIVEQTLRDNSFPETMIMSLMNGEYTLMKDNRKKKNGNGIKPVYKIFPHAICKSRDIKKCLLKLKERNILFAESTKNTKINHIRVRKTQTPNLLRTNVILFSKCVCGLKYRITATKFNETADMAVQI